MSLQSLIAALGAALLAALATWSLLRYRAARQRAGQRARARHGHTQEAAAAERLAAHGCTVLARHPEARYTYTVDGAPHPAKLTADYRVRRGDRQLIVEVKTGAGARPGHRATRRQLLEYALHFPDDGLLLYDADRDQLSEICFPHRPPAEPAASGPRRALWFALGLTVGALLMALAH